MAKRSKEVLVIIDMQQEFIQAAEGYAHLDGLDKHVRGRVRSVRRHMPVIWGFHQEEDTPISPPLIKPAKADTVRLKSMQSIYHGENRGFFRSLKERGVETVNLCGVFLSCCITKSGLDLLDQFRVNIVDDLSGDMRPEWKPRALDYLRQSGMGIRHSSELGV